MRSDKTKIICTLSKSMVNESLLSEMMLMGMDVSRINFSHSSFDDALEIIALLRRLRKELRTPHAIMLDTKGPEVRLYGRNAKTEVKSGDLLTLTSYTGGDIEDIIPANDRTFNTNLPNLEKIVSVGDKILISDGMIVCNVSEISGKRVVIEVKNQGSFRSKAHLNIPGKDYKLKFLSNKDAEDISFAVRENLEYIALSFVSRAEDIFQVKNLIYDIDPNSKIKLISKIENKTAIDNLDEIIRHSDGIMVARGDLGVELDIEEVPVIQKKIVRDCYMASKPVIVATQMLESMIDHRLPTRAEVSDVANACFDLTSAIMLSGETAIGKYPLLVVETMEKIVRSVERSFHYEDFLKFHTDYVDSSDLANVITYSAVTTAYKCKAKSLVVFTKSGHSAQVISRLRPGLPIYAIVLDEMVYNQLALNWGVFPYLIEDNQDFEVLIKRALTLLKRDNLLNSGDTVVIIAGVPLGIHGKTNMLRVETVA